MLALLLVSTACSSDGSGDGGTSSADGNDETPTSGTIASESDLPEAARSELTTALTEVMDRYQVPGVVVAEAGVADLDTGDPVSAETVWPLRSLTKSFTVTVLLQLVDEGVLSLDDTIDQYVDGVPEGDTMTLGHLADMSSGVGDYTKSDRFIDVLIGDPTRRFTLEELNEYGLAEGAQFAPGSDHVYSNTAPNIRAVVIETVTGQPIGDVIETRIIRVTSLQTGISCPCSTTSRRWEPRAP